jgi:hypothetical protein
MIVAAVWSAALAGGALGVTTLTGRATPAPAPTPHVGEQFNANRVGGRVTTSFGSLSVGSIEDMAGPIRAMHLQSVPRGMHPIQVNVTINNTRRTDVRYDRSWFRLVGPRASYPVVWTNNVGTLPGLSERGVLLRLAVPKGVRLPQLEFRDPAGRAPVRVDLGLDKGLQTFNPYTHQHGG